MAAAPTLRSYINQRLGGVGTNLVFVGMRMEVSQK